MSDWTAGYVADVGYTFGYYGELNPLRVKLALLHKGLVCPEFKTACELGFGQGLSTNLHAAASSTHWFGTDFNPSQAGFAQELSLQSAANAQLFDQSFEEFANRDDLPDFDFIGLHGIWSWISDANRQVIVDFISRKLNVGGVLYISYNTLPGWASFAPMRHLMTEHAEVIGAEGRGIVNRVSDAVEFANKLMKTNPLFARANPGIAERLNQLKDQNKNYLAHEYFNKDWHPMHFATMADWLKPAKMQFACSANFHEQVENLNVTAEQLAFLNEIPDPMFRESVKDFMVNQQFRRDIWVKGERKLSLLEQAEAVRKEKVVLITARDAVSLKVKAVAGEAEMSPEVYNPILDYLADQKLRTIEQIEQAVKEKNLNLSHVISAIVVLLGNNAIQLVQDEGAVQKARKNSEKLNAYIKQKARSGGEIGYLASPATGGGIFVGRFHMLFMLAMDNGVKTVEGMAEFVWKILQMQGQKLLKEGKTLESNDENLAELRAIAKVFVEKSLPLMKTLALA